MGLSNIRENTCLRQILELLTFRNQTEPSSEHQNGITYHRLRFWVHRPRLSNIAYENENDGDIEQSENLTNGHCEN